MIQTSVKRYWKTQEERLFSKQAQDTNKARFKPDKLRHKYRARSNQYCKKVDH